MQGRHRRKSHGKQSLLKIITAVGIIAATSVTAVGFMFYNADQQNKMKEKEVYDQNVSEVLSQDVIYENIFINDISVSGLTRAEASDKLNSQLVQPAMNKTIILQAGEETASLTFGELGFQYAVEEALNTAWNYGRVGEKEERYMKIMELQETSLAITAEHTYNQQAVRAAVEALAEKVDVEPQNGTLTRQSGSFQVLGGQDGRKLNIERTVSDISDMIGRGQEGVLEAEIETVSAEYSEEDLKMVKNLLGTYESSFTAGDNGRNTNIRTATEKVNGTVLYPGEVFSTNAAFGAMTYDNGYRPAPVIVDGELEDDMGGGVCQVSSTLYNAVLFSELKVVERRNHSLKVAYMPYAFDATLAGDYIDFKFENDTDYPVYLEGLILNGSKVQINIYGNESRDPGRKLVFQNALVETLPPAAEEVVEDSSLPLGERVVETSAKTGYKYNLYKIVYQNDQEVERVLVNTSTYRTVRGKVRVGTGPASETDVQENTEQVPDQENISAAAETPQPDPEPLESQPEVDIPALEEPVDGLDPAPVDDYLDNMPVEDYFDGPLMPE